MAERRREPRLTTFLGVKVRPFLVRGLDGNMTCLFMQDAPFAPRKRSPLAAPFTCFPPFNAQPDYRATRGWIFLTALAAERLLEIDAGPRTLHALAVIIEQKIAADAGCTKIEISRADVNRYLH